MKLRYWNPSKSSKYFLFGKIVDIANIAHIAKNAIISRRKTFPIYSISASI